MPSPIIIDTDPGIDDALALTYAYASKLPVERITTVYGNADIESVTLNAGYIVSKLECNWPIHKGSSAPISGTPHLAESHGQAGLGNITPKLDEVRTFERSSAAEALVSMLETNKATVLLCLGPLTNIAKLLNDRPDLITKLDRVIIMGGAFTEKGNVTEYAEFNVYNDPESFEYAIENLRLSKLPTLIIPAEVCRTVTLTYDDANKIQERGVLDDINAIVKPFIDYYMNDKVHGGFAGAVMYDVLIPVALQHPEYFQTHPVRVMVEKNGEKRGLTTATDDTESSIQLCSAVISKKAKSLIMDTLS